MKTNPLLPIALTITASPETAAFLRTVLQLSFQLVERSDVDFALETLPSLSIDLVIFDSANIAEASLFPLLHRLRAKLGKRKIPLLLITNNLKKRFAQAALSAGATDFINTPLHEDEIEQRIAVAFQSLEKSQNVAQIARRSTPHLPTTSSSSLKDRELLNDEAMKAISYTRKTEGVISLLILELHSAHKKSGSISEENFTSLTSAVQKACHQNLRKHDVFIPQNPGKFLLVLPKTSQRAAEIIAESIRRELEPQISPFLISIGIVTWDHAQREPVAGSVAEELDHLTKVATEAASRAQKTGSPIISIA